MFFEITKASNRGSSKLFRFQWYSEIYLHWLKVQGLVPISTQKRNFAKYIYIYIYICDQKQNEQIKLVHLAKFFEVSLPIILNGATITPKTKDVT